MTRSLGNTIADSLHLSLMYAERLLKDVTPQQFARLAVSNGTSVNSNHAAFVYGHLSLYAPRILTDLGHTAPPIPAAFQAAFSKDEQCVDDPDGSIYPAMNDVTEFLFSGYRAAADALRAVNDDVLQRQNPLEGRMRDLFPTVGSMHNFYCGGHFMIHMGQVSAWRRMLGLGPA